jgi:CheY-like chemotaxis protein
MDPTQVNQILMNLFTNSAHAMRDKGGTITVSLKDIELNQVAESLLPDLVPGEYLVLSVRDTGHGMAPEVVAQAFDPYFTTKEIGNGTGMGLSVVHGIVRNMRGAIRVESEQGTGTTFDVFLPLTTREPEPEYEKPAPLPTGKERILFVDDQEPIAAVGTEIFRYLQYDVTVMTDSVEALKTFREHPEMFDMVVTDMSMPNLSGIDLSLELLRIRPGLPIILCTGFSNETTEETLRQKGIRALLIKPYSLREIAETVRRVLDSSRPRVSAGSVL